MLLLTAAERSIDFYDFVQIFLEVKKRKIVEKRDSHAWSILTSLHAYSCLN